MPDAIACAAAVPVIGEVRLGAGGKGEGKLATAAKVRFDTDKRQVEIED